MKMVKSLLLGSAAGLVAIAGAQAADLPVKAKPVQYVKICSLYGAGFYYMPGTDTCLKIGGYVRSEVDLNMGGSGSVPGTLHLDNRNESWSDWRTRANLTADARTQTEYGTLRSYLNLAATSDNSGTSNSAFPAPNNANGDSAYIRLYAYAAFIQFAGFTFGKTDTFFDFDGMPYTNTTVYWGTNEGGNGVQVWAYTAQFGNGLSASLSLEDPSSERNGIFPNTYANTTWPEFVANLRVDQAWGSAQIMGALHNVRAMDVLGFHPSDEIGYALGAGVKVNLPWSKGDYLIGQVTYANGALRYITGNNGTGTLQTVTSGFPSASPAFGPVQDAVVLSAGTAANSLDLTEGWSLTAGLEHYWQPNLKTSLWGDYGKVDYGTGVGSASAVLGYADASWSLWQIGSRTVYTVVPNLDLSLEVLYNSMDGANTGVAATTNSQDWVSGMIRVQRNFMP